MQSSSCTLGNEIKWNENLGSHKKLCINVVKDVQHLYTKEYILNSIQYNLNQIPSWLFSGNWHTNSKMFRKMQSAKNNWGNLEEQKDYSGGPAISDTKTYNTSTVIKDLS